MFVVDNLQHYLMADVLESQFALLMAKLDNSVNFEEIRHSHEVFLSSVVAHTFVLNKEVSGCLLELLRVCQQYCWVFGESSGGAGGQEPMESMTNSDSAAKILSNLGVTFSRQSGQLFKILSSIQTRATGNQLAQLLLRIDYNRYFSSHAFNIKKISAT